MRILEDIAAGYLLRRSRVKRGADVSRRYAVAIVATLAGVLMIGALVASGALVIGNPPAASCYAPCTVHFADNVAEDNYRADFTRTRDGAPALVVTTTTKGR